MRSSRRSAHEPGGSPAYSVPPVRTEARFPDIPEKAGHYESFYLKLVQPGGGRGAWIRHTVHKRPGEEITCAIWFVLFDSSAAGPRATKRQFGADELSADPTPTSGSPMRPSPTGAPSAGWRRTSSRRNGI